MTPAHDWLLRTATLADAPAINDIFNHYVVHTTTTFCTEPTSLEEREKWLSQRVEAHPVIVAEWGRRVVGFGALGAFRPRAAYARTVEMSVNIHRDFHRRGLGRAIITELIARARALGHHALVGGCCGENTPSIALLENFGFARVGHFPEVGRKFDRWLDVVFLQLTL
jgi:L-amino acid N-acyltransferase